jgi:hypothetical protein
MAKIAQSESVATTAAKRVPSARKKMAQALLDAL